MRKLIKNKEEMGWREGFAWHPVKIDNYWVWLEVVERKYNINEYFHISGDIDWKYEITYRFIENEI